jgi:hypothetical protein
MNTFAFLKTFKKSNNCMKRLIIVLSLFSVILAFNSCNEVTPYDPARLEVNVYYNGEKVVNAAVALASSEINLKQGDYLAEARTDISGLATFGAVDPGTYYFDSYYYTDNNQTYLYAQDVIRIQAGHTYSLDLHLQKD